MFTFQRQRGDTPAIVNAMAIAAIYTDLTGTSTMVRLTDGGKAIKVSGTFQETVDRIKVDVPLVVLARYERPSEIEEQEEEIGGDSDEDTDPVVTLAPAPVASFRGVAIAIAHIAAILSDGDGVTLVRVANGKGFRVADTPASVVRAIAA